MTVRKKAEKEGMELDTVMEIAASAGINIDDVDRELDQAEAIALGKAVKGTSTEPIKKKEESEMIRFWSTRRNYTFGHGIVDENSVEFENHVLLLNRKTDAKLIDTIRRLRNTDIFEIKNVPFEEDSEDYFKFDKLMNDIMITGANGEVSKMGVKAVRALFSPNELLEMGEFAFTPQRLKSKALRTKSYILLANNGIM